MRAALGQAVPMVAIWPPAAIGALQPMADDAAYGWRCPIPAIRNTRRDRLNWVERWHYRFDRPVMATLRKRSFTAWRHDTCHHANFSASAGRSTGRRISSLMRGCRSSEPRITAWT